jgi:hypothetical protein
MLSVRRIELHCRTRRQIYLRSHRDHERFSPCLSDGDAACDGLVVWLILWHKPFQGAIQSLPDPNNRCKEHVQLPRLNSLNIADVQVCHFREPLLADGLGETFPTYVAA